MKILVISPYYKPAYVYGGTVRCISQLCEALVKLGSHVTVITTNVNGKKLLEVPLGKASEVDGVEVFYYPIVCVPPRNFFYAPSFAKASGKKIREYDIVVLEQLYSYGMKTVTNTCMHTGIPYVVQTHGQLLPWSLRQKWLKKQLYLFIAGRAYLNKSAAIHCTDESEARATKLLGIKAPTFIVPNGIDTEHFAKLPVRGNIRRRYQISDNARLLLFMGRLHAKKRPDIAIEALGSAQSLSPETHLLLAGPDESKLTPKLLAQAERSGCRDKLHITGLLEGDEILSALADADLFLMPSEPESENFGMSAVEAMAAGLPILVSEGVPIGRWAELAGAGRVVPTSGSSFKQVTCELLSNTKQLVEMGQKGRIFARKKFDISIIAQLMLEQYQAIISTGHPLKDGDKQELNYTRANSNAYEQMNKFTVSKK